MLELFESDKHDTYIYDLDTLCASDDIMCEVYILSNTYWLGYPIEILPSMSMENVSSYRSNKD